MRHMVTREVSTSLPNHNAKQVIEVCYMRAYVQNMYMCTHTSMNTPVRAFA